MKCDALAAYDNDIRAMMTGALCGVDEAGRGPLAGPVCCAAVILNPAVDLGQINDSKKLSEAVREQLYNKIIESCIAYSVVLIDHETIDRVNILHATMLGMRQAVEELSVTPELVLIDGNRCPDIDVPARAVVHGDALSASLAAVSILAKVSRDRFMIELDARYPQYGFAQHKGYPTKLHYARIDEYGLCPYHRRSFLKGRVTT